MITVLVTGVGAIIGYGLLQSLRISGANLRLIGTDIYPDAVGQTWCDVFEQAPETASSDFPVWLQDVVKRNDVDLLIPAIEQDVYKLTDLGTKCENLGCKIALNNPDLIRITYDKWLMHQELLLLDDDARIPSFLTGTYDDLSKELGEIFILKLRRSYASKGLVNVRSYEDFMPYVGRLGRELMAQPLVGTDEQEYTAGIFGDGKGNIACSILFQRRLARDGSTAKAWVRHDASLDVVIKRLCQHFKPLGPTNLQFRKHDNCWKLLEINPRISSTSSLRTAFGYNEAQMCLDFYLDGKLPSQPKIRDGFAVRYIKDYVVYDRDNF